MTRASLPAIRHAVDVIVDWLGRSSGYPLAEAVDVTCDYLHVGDPRDRAIIRRAVERRLSPESRRVSA